MARDPYRYFRIEARELLDQLGKGALELDREGSNPGRIAVMLRLAHTLKGAARVVKQREIADFAHAIEDALTPLREAGAAVSRDGVDAMQKALDGIALRLDALAPAPEVGAVSDNGSAGEGGALTEEGPLATLTTNRDEMDILLESLNEASVQVAALRREIEPLQSAQGIAGRVYRDCSDSVTHLDRELGEVREAAERLRLLPANLMFVPLERAARDAARALNKRIAVVTSGGEVRLDAQVFGVMQNALMQTVRNAAVHGIETTEERQAAGKAAEGHVWVEVRQRGHQAVFVCRDDGRGVDLEAVRRVMARKGLLSAEVAKLKTDELLELLLGGGISTAGAVTQHAGRGIGLDIVREAASRLRGNVSIKTDKGAGTRVEIVVPVTIAAMDAVMVEAGGRTVGIPLHAVKRTVRIAIGDLAQSAQGASILFEGNVVPFAPLERALRRGTETRERARAWSAIVIQGANSLAAVGVERLRGTQNLIVRPLPDLTPSDRCVGGASLDAEGHPQLVLDPQGLVEHILGSGAMPAVRPAPRAAILVIDDSLTTRMLEQSILESAGYEVDLATSGEQALEQAHQRRYALFLVDVEMPGMDGFTFIARAAADAALRDVPAILVTSRNSPEDRQRGESVGARAYVVKGEFDQTKLLDTIRSLVGGQ